MTWTPGHREVTTMELRFLRFVYYCLTFLTVEVDAEPVNIGNVTTDVDYPLASSHHVKIGSLPPGHLRPTDPLIDLRRKYKIRDFLWAGSGDGPMASEQDGGLAWEDNGGDVRGDDDYASVILVTKTMVLFKTVMTTVYPVELTPTVVISTPLLTRTPSLPEDSSSPALPYTSLVTTTTRIVIEPSPTFVFPIEPTARPTSPPTSDPLNTTGQAEEIPTPAPDTSLTTNPIYWVNTIIKANASDVRTPSVKFNDTMQEKLAQVYASVFKRHLLNSLRILNQTTEVKGHRKRRSASPEHGEDYEWLFLSVGSPSAKLQRQAETAMNVSVSFVNITVNEEERRVSMDYIVIAEGKPVPAASAVEDIHLVSKPEMERQIGYEVIKMAEALSSPPPVHEPSSPQKTAGNSSVWPVVALMLMFLSIVLIVILGIVAWKLKQKRVNERQFEVERRSGSTGIEAGGVLNRAFVGPPSSSGTSRMYQEREQKTGRPSSKVTQRQKVGMSGSTGQSGQERMSQQKSLAKDLGTILSDDQKMSPSSIIREDSYYITGQSTSGSEQNSPHSATIVIKTADEGAGSKAISKTKKIRNSSLVSRPRSPMKRLSPNRRAGTAVGRRREQPTADGREQTQGRPLSASSREKVTFGHLDICDDPVAKPISDEAKKLIKPRHQSARTRGVETTISSSSTTTKTEKKEMKRIREFDLSRHGPIAEGASISVDEEDNSADTSLCEKDREIEERVDASHFRSVVPHASTSPTKDAQVQTPVRLKGVVKGKPKAKPRRFTSATKKSAESLISTESEEIIEVHRLDEASSEANPLGRMRKRFHQFLDDAFNVIGKKEGDVSDTRTKSAKVSLTHHIETKELSRPWTSSRVTRGETLESPRPKSASIGAPKRAWTASTERRCHSATSTTSARSRAGCGGGTSRGGAELVLEERDSEDEPDQNSSPLSTIETPSSDGNRSYMSSIGPAFPRYPIYPDIPYPGADPGQPQPGSGEDEERRDPAVPLIAAIKEEIKRFERLKVPEHQQQYHSRWST